MVCESAHLRPNEVRGRDWDEQALKTSESKVVGLQLSGPAELYLQFCIPRMRTLGLLCRLNLLSGIRFLFSAALFADYGPSKPSRFCARNVRSLSSVLRRLNGDEGGIVSSNALSETARVRPRNIRQQAASHRGLCMVCARFAGNQPITAVKRSAQGSTSTRGNEWTGPSYDKSGNRSETEPFESPAKPYSETERKVGGANKVAHRS
jgi:hypothetical protein